MCVDINLGHRIINIIASTSLMQVSFKFFEQTQWSYAIMCPYWHQSIECSFDWQTRDNCDKLLLWFDFTNPKHLDGWLRSYRARVIYGSTVIPLTLASRSFHCDSSCHIEALMPVVCSLSDCRWSTSTWGFNYLYANLIPLPVVSLPHQLSTNDMCLTVCRFRCYRMPFERTFVSEFVFRRPNSPRICLQIL